MNEEKWTMSHKKIERLAVLEKVLSRRITQSQAAVEMGVCERHLRRLLRGYRQYGARALLSRRRAVSPNNRVPASVRRRALELVREHYPDFGPTFAHEKLCQHHRHEFSRGFSSETLRGWMIKDGLWKQRRRRAPRVHPPRPRCRRFGELIQVDGSAHEWFEDRAGACTLIAFIDDATSMVTEWRFCQSETTFDYFESVHRHLVRYGRPLCIYSDRHGIFRVNAQEKHRLHEDTQFARAMKQLDIKPMCANTPQAKGRIERLFKTAQDRLVKELRLQGISTMEQANAFLEGYREVFNEKFAQDPADADDAHRECFQDEKERKRILSKQSTRVVSNNLVCQYRNCQYIVQVQSPSYALRGARVTVCEHRDGEIVLLYKGRELPYKVYRQGEALTAPVDAKRLPSVVDKVVARQRRGAGHKPAPDHPWRRWQGDPESAKRCRQ